MRFYIATSLDNAGAHNVMRGQLEASVPGAELTYNWTEHGSVQHEGKDRIRQVALAEAEGVISADVVIVLLPGGRGTHVELGMAIAAGVPVILVVTPEHTAANPHTCAFYHHPLVRIVEGEVDADSTMEAIMAALSEWPWGLR